MPILTYFSTIRYDAHHFLFSLFPVLHRSLMFLHTLCVDSMRSGKFLELSALFQFNWLDIIFANLSNFILTNHMLNSLGREFSPWVSRSRCCCCRGSGKVQSLQTFSFSSCSCISNFPSRLNAMLLLPSRFLCLTVDCENEIIWRPKSDFFHMQQLLARSTSRLSNNLQSYQATTTMMCYSNVR